MLCLTRSFSWKIQQCCQASIKAPTKLSKESSSTRVKIGACDRTHKPFSYTTSNLPWMIPLETIIHRLAEMISISLTNLVGEINFHITNWNFHLSNFCVFVSYLLLPFLIFFKTDTVTVKKLIKWLNLFQLNFQLW